MAHAHTHTHTQLQTNSGVAGDIKIQAAMIFDHLLMVDIKHLTLSFKFICFFCLWLSMI